MRLRRIALARSRSSCSAGCRRRSPRGSVRAARGRRPDVAPGDVHQRARRSSARTAPGTCCWGRSSAMRARTTSSRSTSAAASGPATWQRTVLTNAANGVVPGAACGWRPTGRRWPSGAVTGGGRTTHYSRCGRRAGRGAAAADRSDLGVRVRAVRPQRHRRRGRGLGGRTRRPGHTRRCARPGGTWGAPEQMSTTSTAASRRGDERRPATRWSSTRARRRAASSPAIARPADLGRRERGDRQQLPGHDEGR